MSDATLSGAERQRRLRVRRQHGAATARIEVSAEVRRALVAAGFCSDAEAADPAELAGNVADLLECWAQGRLDTAPRATEEAQDMPAPDREDAPAALAEGALPVADAAATAPGDAPAALVAVHIPKMFNRSWKPGDTITAEQLASLPEGSRTHMLGSGMLTLMVEGVGTDSVAASVPTDPTAADVALASAKASLEELVKQRGEAQAELKDFGKRRRKHAHAALAKNDPAARKALDRLSAEARTVEDRIGDLGHAIEEAQQLMAAAEEAKRRDEERANAARVRTILEDRARIAAEFDSVTAAWVKLFNAYYSKGIALRGTSPVGVSDVVLRMVAPSAFAWAARYVIEARMFPNLEMPQTEMRGSLAEMTAHVDVPHRRWTDGLLAVASESEVAA